MKCLSVFGTLSRLPPHATTPAHSCPLGVLWSALNSCPTPACSPAACPALLQLKKILSANSEAPINVESLQNDVDGSGMMTRDAFEEMAKPVLDRLPRDGTLLVIDTNAGFIEYLQRTIHDSRFLAVHGSAEDVEEIVRAHGHDYADYVLSGLPFSTLPEGVAPRIAEATYRVVRPGGAFLTYQFSKVARNYTARHFERMVDGFEPRNILPCVLAWGWKEPAPAE